MEERGAGYISFNYLTHDPSDDFFNFIISKIKSLIKVTINCIFVLTIKADLNGNILFFQEKEIRTNYTSA